MTIRHEINAVIMETKTACIPTVRPMAEMSFISPIPIPPFENFPARESIQKDMKQPNIELIKYKTGFSIKKLCRIIMIIPEIIRIREMTFGIFFNLKSTIAAPRVAV